MSEPQMKLVIVGVAVVAVVVILIYNGFIGKRNAVRFAFAGIDAQLKKRFDLFGGK